MILSRRSPIKALLLVDISADLLSSCRCRVGRKLVCASGDPGTNHGGVGSFSTQVRGPLHEELLHWVAISWPQML